MMPPMPAICYNDNEAVLNLQVPVSLKNFLFPVETDESLLETYMAAVATETVK